jgi:hypothetical protein
MTEHVPECHYVEDTGDVEYGWNECICPELRACEKRISEKYKLAMEGEGTAYSSGFEWGHAEALRTAKDALEDLFSKSHCGAGYVSCSDSTHPCKERRYVISTIGLLDPKNYDYKDASSLIHSWFNSFDDDPNFSDYLRLVRSCESNAHREEIAQYFTSEREAMEQMDRTWNTALDYAISEVERLVPKPGAYEEHYLIAIKSLKRLQTW